MNRFKTGRRVLFGDCDPAGIVYTPRVSHFVVEAGLEFLDHRFGGSATRQLFRAGIAPPARALSMEFLHPMRWDDLLDIEVHVARLGNTSVTLECRGTVNGITTFTATMTMAFVNTETMSSTEIPESVRAQLTEPD
ncbi:thioesterase family protein [uncultured Abyssibacter sp.]|uniref:acyl-CoA thioesterase n=1 Tax=uncultured Abyssibacter sp. TaxID=2320202 RepID=UPI0032B14E22